MNINLISIKLFKSFKFTVFNSNKRRRSDQTINDRIEFELFTFTTAKKKLKSYLKIMNCYEKNYTVKNLQKRTLTIKKVELKI